MSFLQLKKPKFYEFFTAFCDQISCILVLACSCKAMIPQKLALGCFVLLLIAHKFSSCNFESKESLVKLTHFHVGVSKLQPAPSTGKHECRRPKLLYSRFQ